MCARELGGSAGSSPIPGAAGNRALRAEAHRARHRRRTAAPYPQPGASRRYAAAVTARTEADRAVRLAPGILSPRKITIKGAPTGASPQAGQTLDTDLPRQDPGTYQTDGPDSTRPLTAPLRRGGGRVELFVAGLHRNVLADP